MSPATFTASYTPLRPQPLALPANPHAPTLDKSREPRKSLKGDEDSVAVRTPGFWRRQFILTVGDKNLSLPALDQKFRDYEKYIKRGTQSVLGWGQAPGCLEEAAAALLHVPYLQCPIRGAPRRPPPLLAPPGRARRAGRAHDTESSRRG